MFCFDRGFSPAFFVGSETTERFLELVNRSLILHSGLKVQVITFMLNMPTFVLIILITWFHLAMQKGVTRFCSQNLLTGAFTLWITNVFETVMPLYSNILFCAFGMYIKSNSDFFFWVEKLENDFIQGLLAGCPDWRFEYQVL